MAANPEIVEQVIAEACVNLTLVEKFMPSRAGVKPVSQGNKFLLDGTFFTRRGRTSGELEKFTNTKYSLHAQGRDRTSRKIPKEITPRVYVCMYER